MKSVQYDIAIRTYMEAFDYLITNDLFVFSSDKDFLLSKITIDEYGFVEEIQSSRGVWEEEHPNMYQKRIPVLRVVDALNKSIESILPILPPSSKEGYAYVHTTKSMYTGVRNYYKTYGEILDIYKEAYSALSKYNGRGREIINIELLRNKKNVEELLKMSELEKRKIECYALLEQTIADCTSDLLLVDNYGNPLDELGIARIACGIAEPKFSSDSTYVNWEDFKEAISGNVQYVFENGEIDLHGVYNPFRWNQYISDLGLDGLTK